MSIFLSSTGHNLLLSPSLGRTGTLTPVPGRIQFINFTLQKPGNFGVARFGLGQVPFPDQEDAELVIKELFSRAEGFLYTIADAAVSSSETVDAISTTKQNSDWLSGFTNAMEMVLKVLEDGLSTLHIPYSYGFAIVLLTILVKAATYPLTKKQVESAMAMQSLTPQIKAIQERYAGEQERVQLKTVRLYKLAGINPLAGCLPTIATIPKRIGLYRALSNVTDEVDENGGLTSISDDMISDKEALKVKEWEVGMLQDEIAASQGIMIRRRPPTRPPPHYVGPFELCSQHVEAMPRNILEEIVWYKNVEVCQMKQSTPLSMLKNFVDNAPPTKNFVGALKAAYSRTGLPGLIAEVKKASPSRGVMREDFDPIMIAKAYEKGGAACLSVLTDKKFFQGGFENLEAIRNSGVQCPLLCKEFVVDPWQIYYARVKGADAILLIAAVLPDLDIKYMLKICKMLGVAALVEVHDEREMDRVLAIEGIKLVGINNRDLGTFKVDIINTKKLLEGERGERIREKDIIVVGESALFTPADIAYVQGAGCKAVLVGESIVKKKDPTAGIIELFGKDISA